MDSGFGIGGHSKSITQMTTDRLDYWSPFIVENGVEKSYVTEIRPQSISGDGPIEFHLAPNPERFIDISTLTLNGRVGIRVKGDDGTWKNLDKDNGSKVSVVNNFFQSLWSSITIKVNDCEIGDYANNSYPYTSYLQTLLGTSYTQRDSHINKQRCFIKDESAFSKIPNPTTVASFAYNERKLLFHDTSFVDFSIPIHNDLMTVEKYLPPNTKLSFTLRRTSDDFVLWKHSDDTGEYKVVLEELHMKLKLLQVTQEVFRNHERMHKTKGELKIKYTQNVLKTFAVPQGSVELKQHNLFFGKRLPTRVYVAFVDQNAYNGDIKQNPYYFDRANMQEAVLIVNGVPEPSPPYTFEEGINEKDLYFNFLENTGSSPFELDSVNVSLDEFKNGYFILPFDRSPSKDNGLYTHKSEGGSLTVKVKCKEALKNNYMVLVFASYESALTFVEDKVVSDSIY